LPSADTVHDVVDALADLGWSRVVVGGALSHRETDLGLVDVEGVLVDASYLGSTHAARVYERADLSQAMVESACPPSSLLFGVPVSAMWARAGLRMVVARWAPDVEDVFRACSSALTACAGDLPGAAPADVCADVALHFPPAFAIVEAAGGVDDDATPTLIAGGDVVSTDVVSAVLHGVDPTTSATVRACVRSIGLPENLQVDHGLTALAPRRAETRVADDTLRRFGSRLPGAARTLRVLMAPDQDDRDDGDDILRFLQQSVGRFVRPDERSGPVPVTAEAIAAAMSAWADSLSAWRVNFAKDDVPRITAPLGFDPGRYRDADYRAIPPYLATFSALLGAAPREESWLRWCYFDGSVLFEVERELNASFGEFVERVDVAEGISIMADYLGGRRVVVARDERDRAVMQAERNIYLPQPNYLAYWGGKPIDVCKIELVSYDGGQHRLYWKTIASPNDSADYDDGVLSFTDSGDHRTRITISGRQQFRLPLFWQAVNLDQYPAIKNQLVTDAYRRFFSATFDNFEACFEGRPYRIGTEATAQTRGLPTEGLTAYLDIGREWLAERRAAPPRVDYQVDEHGFRHFAGAKREPEARTVPPWVRTAQDIAAEYAAAIRADAETLPRW
jgi:hypothetical protein